MNMLTVIFVAATAASVVIGLVYIILKIGKKIQKAETMENEVKDAIKAKKRINKRRNDSINTINKRMRKHVID